MEGRRGLRMEEGKYGNSGFEDTINRRYDIKRRIGKGAYGIVWKAVDRRSKEVVAVKKIFNAFDNSTDAQRTYREILYLKAFQNHPNIVTLLDLHRAGNDRDIYLVFEFMDMDLLGVINKSVIAEAEIKLIVHQILKAVEHIHSGDIVHRDLKPSNILVSSRGVCKIADFGLSRCLRGRDFGVGGDDRGAHDDVIGVPLTDYVATRWYRPPEILLASKRYTKGIDMWSIGCILGEMICRKPLFPGKSTIHQLELVMSSIPRPSQEDIDDVCRGSYGSVLARNGTLSASTRHQTLVTLLPEATQDSLLFLGRLLVFNPHKRLTASSALRHPFISRHDENICGVRKGSVPVATNHSDDVKLTASEYRMIIYQEIEKRKCQNRRRYKKLTLNHAVSNYLSGEYSTNEMRPYGDCVPNKIVEEREPMRIQGSRYPTRSRIPVVGPNSSKTYDKSLFEARMWDSVASKKSPIRKNSQSTLTTSTLNRRRIITATDI